MPKTPQGSGLSGRAYAKRRGVTHEAVRKAIRTGRISVRPDGTINPRTADRQWARNTDETKPRNSVSGDPKHRRTPGEPSAPAGGKGASAPGAASYTAARAMREVYNARLARIEFEKAEGRLVNADEVKATAFEVARRVRDSVLSVPDRISSILAGYTDEADVRRELVAELRKALEELGGAR